MPKQTLTEPQKRLIEKVRAEPQNWGYEPLGRYERAVAKTLLAKGILIDPGAAKFRHGPLRVYLP